jgi:hypothetical protein
MDEVLLIIFRIGCEMEEVASTEADNLEEVWAGESFAGHRNRNHEGTYFRDCAATARAVCRHWRDIIDFPPQYTGFRFTSTTLRRGWDPSCVRILEYRLAESQRFKSDLHISIGFIVPYENPKDYENALLNTPQIFDLLKLHAHRLRRLRISVNDDEVLGYIFDKLHHFDHKPICNLAYLQILDRRTLLGVSHRHHTPRLIKQSEQSQGHEVIGERKYQFQPFRYLESLMELTISNLQLVHQLSLPGSLRILDVRCACPGEAQLSSHKLIERLLTLLEGCPSLDTLKLTWGDWAKYTIFDAPDWSSLRTVRHSTLTTLDLIADMVSMYILWTKMDLPSLNSLRICFAYKLWDLEPPPLNLHECDKKHLSEVSFPSLRLLKIHGLDDTCLLSLLDIPNLEELDIEFRRNTVDQEPPILCKRSLSALSRLQPRIAKLTSHPLIGLTYSFLEAINLDAMEELSMIFLPNNSQFTGKPSEQDLNVQGPQLEAPALKTLTVQGVSPSLVLKEMLSGTTLSELEVQYIDNINAWSRWYEVFNHNPRIIALPQSLLNIKALVLSRLDFVAMDVSFKFLDTFPFLEMLSLGDIEETILATILKALKPNAGSKKRGPLVPRLAQLTLCSRSRLLSPAVDPAKSTFSNTLDAINRKRIDCGAVALERVYLETKVWTNFTTDKQRRFPPGQKTTFHYGTDGELIKCGHEFYGRLPEDCMSKCPCHKPRKYICT